MSIRSLDWRDFVRRGSVLDGNTTREHTCMACGTSRPGGRPVLCRTSPASAAAVATAPSCSVTRRAASRGRKYRRRISRRSTAGSKRLRARRARSRRRRRNSRTTCARAGVELLVHFICSIVCQHFALYLALLITVTFGDLQCNQPKLQRVSVLLMVLTDV